MGNIVTVEANKILNSSVKGTAYVAATTPVNLALITTTTPSTASVIGSEVTGASYARQDTTTGAFWGSASAGAITNSAGAISFTSMPSCIIGGIELWDSVTRSTAADGNTTNGSTTVTSATAAFTAADIGQKITGGSIPALTTIASVTNSTTAVLSAAPTATTTTATFVIVTPVRRWFGVLGANKTVNSGDTVTFNTSSISISLA